MSDMTPMQKIVVKHVRTLMKELGKNHIFTNKYKSGTRTVKCYAGNTNVEAFTRNVNSVMRQIGVAGVTVKHIRKPIKMWGPNSSIIVRIPDTI